MRQGRRGRRAINGAIVPLHGWIIDLYAPYVLVRCVGFTNDRSQALVIGAYTLITTCLMADQLDHLGQLGISIDVVAEVVGPDVIGGHGDNPDRRSCGCELLIADEQMMNLAVALNLLDRPLREAIILHCVGGFAVNDMAKILNRPTTEVAARITRGERLLTGYLSGFHPDTGQVDPCDVRSLLARFEAGLDVQWLREVQDCAIEYLARCDRRTSGRIGHWHLN